VNLLPYLFICLHFVSQTCRLRLVHSVTRRRLAVSSPKMEAPYALVKINFPFSANAAVADQVLKGCCATADSIISLALTHCKFVVVQIEMQA